MSNFEETCFDILQESSKLDTSASGSPAEGMMINKMALLNGEADPGVKSEKPDLYGDGHAFQDRDEDCDNPPEHVNVPKVKKGQHSDPLSHAKKIVARLNVVPENKDYDFVMGETGQGKPTIVYKGHRYMNADKERGETTLSSEWPRVLCGFRVWLLNIYIGRRVFFNP